MVKLLLSLISSFIEGGFTRQRASNNEFTITIYQIRNSVGREFTRIDIFRKDSPNETENKNAFDIE
jgi:hypothetical protein